VIHKFNLKAGLAQVIAKTGRYVNILLAGGKIQATFEGPGLYFKTELYKGLSLELGEFQRLTIESDVDQAIEIWLGRFPLDHALAELKSVGSDALDVGMVTAYYGETVQLVPSRVGRSEIAIKPQTGIVIGAAGVTDSDGYPIATGEREAVKTQAAIYMRSSNPLDVKKYVPDAGTAFTKTANLTSPDGASQVLVDGYRVIYRKADGFLAYTDDGGLTYTTTATATNPILAIFNAVGGYYLADGVAGKLLFIAYGATEPDPTKEIDLGVFDWVDQGANGRWVFSLAAVLYTADADGANKTDITPNVGTLPASFVGKFGIGAARIVVVMTELTQVVYSDDNGATWQAKILFDAITWRAGVYANQFWVDASDRIFYPAVVATRNRVVYGAVSDAQLSYFAGAAPSNVHLNPPPFAKLGGVVYVGGLSVKVVDKPGLAWLQDGAWVSIDVDDGASSLNPNALGVGAVVAYGVRSGLGVRIWAGGVAVSGGASVFYLEDFN